ncbi:MAG: hypothetical protein J6252_02800, partial [Clostridia bacterium]|nr:hypothetical protein [Clostridia bacterium]
MANTVKQKQKRTIIICVALCVLLLAGTLFIILDKVVHLNDPYKQFTNTDLAKTFAAAMGKSGVRDLKQEDIDSIEALVYYFNVQNNSQNNNAAEVQPVVLLGTKDFTDALEEGNDPPEGSYYFASAILTDVNDINLFRNLRVLRMFDLAEVDTMQNQCYNTQLYAMYTGSTAVSFDSLVAASPAPKLTSLKQLSGLTRLEQLSVEYAAITTLEGIESFANLTKLDIGFTAVQSIDGIEKAVNLTEFTAPSAGKPANTAEPEESADESEPEESRTEESQPEESEAEESQPEESETEESQPEESETEESEEEEDEKE